MSQGLIKIRGARQHNLKNLDLDFKTGELTVVTGPSGSGKSSLVFDTLYAEGQRRYVETFSAYARQFLDRMDRPQVDQVEGVPPAIAIDQTNPVRSSRSTVGTMTELNDHLKLLFARLAHLYDSKTAMAVRQDNAQTLLEEITQRVGQRDLRLVVTFAVELPMEITQEEIEQWLSASGFTKIQAQRQVATITGPRQVIDVVADRFRWSQVETSRVVEALETALKRGSGRLQVYASDSSDSTPEVWKFSTGLHCPDSELSYQEPTPSLFSFNSALGACEACRGFGRVIGVDYGLVIPNDRLTLRAGAIKPIQTPAWKDSQDDLMRFAEKAGIPRDTPWYQLTAEQKDWVLMGSPHWNGKWNQQWYGIKRFFEYLETKSYKMHIRVMLSKYRSYTACSACNSARLKTESLLWRVGSKAAADEALPPALRFMPVGVSWTPAQLQALPGLCLHDLMCLSIERLRLFFDRMHEEMAEALRAKKQDLEETRVTAHGGAAVGIGGDPGAIKSHSLRSAKSAQIQALELLLEEIRARLKYLVDVGLGYLSLDRQSRTLSGGEVQRINLTTALGTSLVNTLFVLDEPSIGLHPRDMGRITQAMQRLRDAGNTLVVVEHDPAVMFAADRIIDMGPGPGERGGEIVFDGVMADLKTADTLTGAYLGARKQVGMGLKRAVTDATPRLVLEGATEHNLKNISIEFPLLRLVCVTGVSGSGKSTLMQDILAPALLRHFGQSTDAPGAHSRLLGADYLSDVVFVDQSPIGKTARSNPVSYVGAWDSIRELFADTGLAKQRGYTHSKFSFNHGDGRCPSCGGSGFEHVEMQFLSDVYLRCQDCQGERYRPEILEVKIERQDAQGQMQYLSVSQVLELTVSEAAQLFKSDPEVIRALQPIVDVGLEYLKLGQPVPTLSGGESQRLKLAGYLAQAAKQRSSMRQAVAKKGTLFLFDEPTTGLHFDDIAKLMRALRKLLEAGHSLIVIEHNLDVIRASDWLIDLGPEGGEHGGCVVAEGTPEEIRLHASSHTALALRSYDAALGEYGVLKLEDKKSTKDKAQTAGSSGAAASVQSTQHAFVGKSQGNIQIVNAKEHNLKNLSVNIPRGRFNVITGVSGSGKSTLAFDILFNEGQRRYLESLNAYARSIVQPAGRPEVDAVYGIPPTVAIEQRLSRGGRKSTVGTTTEIWHFLRLLYVKLGVQHCVHDGQAVQAQTPESIVAQIMRRFKNEEIAILAPLVINRKGVYTDLAEWARLKGYTHLRVDGEYLPTNKFPRIDRFKEHTIELPVLSLEVSVKEEALLKKALLLALELGKGVVHVLSDIAPLRAAFQAGQACAGIGRLEVFSTKRACPVCSTSYAELDPRLFSYNSKHGWCTSCVGTGLKLTQGQRDLLDDTQVDASQKGREQTFAEPVLEDVEETQCLACQGTRLNPTARAVRFEGHTITDIARLSVKEISQWAEGLTLKGRDALIAKDLLPEIKGRLKFLEQVGLAYLTLDRGAPSLSGGEAQRIRLAAQLGSNLQGVCYVLDEPTIGLHARDNQMLLRSLQLLCDQGNTLVVVEHDEDTMRQAEHLIDIGPSAGVRGGQLVAQGQVADLEANPDSVTGRYLRQAMRHPFQPRRLVEKKESQAEQLVVKGAYLHNLQKPDITVPLKKLVAVTGVSGSGKSTLARDILLANVQMAVSKKGAMSAKSWLGCEQVLGFEHIDRVLEVDQTPIGKTPRSCPATYIGFWDTIRKLFADTLEAKARGYTQKRFSFNTGDGRCAACEGQGMRTIEMNFLPDVKVKCEVCQGARFNAETLAVTWRGKSIGEVLQMEVDEAVTFFENMPSVSHPLSLLRDVGLGYLTIGQPSPTLSGGEAQRIKLVTELTKVRDEVGKRGYKVPHTLYVLDEPTVGLHMSDVDLLIRVLHRLVDAGHSVVVIEHDLDVIAEADWVIDLGPEGGQEGGRLVAAGTPEEIVRQKTHTGKALKPVLARV